MPLPARLGLALLLSLAAPACAGLSYEHRRVESAPPSRVMSALHPGQSRLQDCLDLLGAPTEVAKDEDGDGFELRWRWSETSGWGFFVALPLSRDFSPSLNWGTQGEQPESLHLFFTADGRLARLSRD